MSWTFDRIRTALEEQVCDGTDTEYDLVDRRVRKSKRFRGEHATIEDESDDHSSLATSEEDNDSCLARSEDDSDSIRDDADDEERI